MKPPFLNLYDIGGILMIILAQAIVLALLGSSSVTWKVVALIGILFCTAIHFAKKGTPN